MKKALYILSISLLVLSCKNEPKTKVAPAHETNKDLNETSNTVTANFTTPEATQLYTDYLSVKAAMVNTDAARTKVAAQLLAKHLEGKETYQSVRMVATLIANTDDMEKQREFFVGLNDQTTTALKDKLASGKIYQQFCPMAFDGKGGYWLSNSDEVRNPYFGDVMLACGEVTEEIK